MAEGLRARAFERFVLEIPMGATLSAAPGGSELDGRVRDVGSGGVQIECADEIFEGTPVTLTLWTRWGSLTLGGNVVWRRPRDGEAVFGLRFDLPIGAARARELSEEISPRGEGG